MVFVHEENGGISIFVHEFRAALLSGAVTRSVGLGIPKTGGTRTGKKPALFFFSSMGQRKGRGQSAGGALPSHR